MSSEVFTCVWKKHSILRACDFRLGNTNSSRDCSGLPCLYNLEICLFEQRTFSVFSTILWGIIVHVIVNQWCWKCHELCFIWQESHDWWFVRFLWRRGYSGPLFCAQAHLHLWLLRAAVLNWLDPWLSSDKFKVRSSILVSIKELSLELVKEASIFCCD